MLYEAPKGATETYVQIDRVLKERLQLMKCGMDSMNFDIDLSGISYEHFLTHK
ncbi:hypothetical protein [Vibrio natriegens]|uniref:hypothetical protein n=1 Tax=Vibrio natriegens TaxID=691 RepID=UPI002E330F9B|nr:hypothetical protein [Vibrio natriegens]